MRANTLDNIYTISIGGKTLLGCCLETLFMQKCLNTYFTPSAI